MQLLEKQEKTRKINPSHWKPGQSGNLKGRPAIPEKRHLENALKRASRNHENVPFLDHIAELAYTDKSVALAVLDKLVPNNQMPKENDESNGIKQIIIIRPERGKEATEIVSRPIRVQSESVSGSVEFMGNGKDNGLNIAGNDIQRAPREQSGSDIP